VVTAGTSTSASTNFAEAECTSKRCHKKSALKYQMTPVAQAVWDNLFLQDAHFAFLLL
jgi:hypothetical protein